MMIVFVMNRLNVLISIDQNGVAMSGTDTKKLIRHKSRCPPLLVLFAYLNVCGVTVSLNRLSQKNTYANSD